MKDLRPPLLIECSDRESRDLDLLPWIRTGRDWRPTNLGDLHHYRPQPCGSETVWRQQILGSPEGAMALPAGELGVLPGSIGTPSFHVQGRGCEEALNSNAHGAGRAMSRSEAARKVRFAGLPSHC
jgi:hypothetical protein